MAKGARHGYTTGACAAAAAKGAALLLQRQRQVDVVTIVLPGGEVVPFALHGQIFESAQASCFVVKDAGDDPDVTNGCEVWAKVQRLPGAAVVITGGIGIGRVTKPGLAVIVGAWAINPVPQAMITAALREVFPTGGVQVEISIPDGVDRAQRTLNARLGILGGLSILGTTGIVKPISHQAWTDTLDAALDVACACGQRTIVLSTGRTSEMVVQRALAKAGISLGEEAFIMMGDHVGYALRACARRNIATIILAGQFAKLLKIACCHEQTHVSASRLDLHAVTSWLRVENFPTATIKLAERANTARHLLADCGTAAPALCALICDRAQKFAQSFAPATEIQVFLAGYDGEVLYFSGQDQLQPRITV
ncbi:MAG: cobalamin biosynthesis protein CbiD [Deltaproteobacteria bacterium HGW-Deltaproteobacteria-4]|nr:MAG: cobalamin biosynthesis protein CbiD [Deltaproteobacteria bacterium HGW-Deltaproteobacteria-4]